MQLESCLKDTAKAYCISTEYMTASWLWNYAFFKCNMKNTAK